MCIIDIELTNCNYLIIQIVQITYPTVCHYQHYIKTYYIKQLFCILFFQVFPFPIHDLFQLPLHELTL